MREKLLSTLVLFYILLLAMDPTFLYRSPSYVNLEALSLILSFMLVSKLMDMSGVFSKVSTWILSMRGRKRILLLLITSELVAALLMNDTALFFLIPLVITLYRMTGGDPSDMLVLITIGANVGSALTPFGNPQNIIIWSHFHMQAISFLTVALPFYLLSSTLLIIFSLKLPIVSEGPAKLVSIRLDLRSAVSALLLLAINLVLASYGYYLIGTITTLLISLLVRKEVIRGIDIPLLVMFTFLFMDFGQLSHILGSMGIIPNLKGVTVLATSALLSQIISNVPATITLLNHTTDWRSLLVGVNLGGTGLIIGSMANFITLRMADLKLERFHKISVPYFLASAVMFILLALAGLYP
ncbi:MAG: SLC13 family permease [Candidatus Korarchaeota archaeon]|nr:SLC13 family permease [Candidatus Korarchaeota archaeon]